MKNILDKKALRVAKNREAAQRSRQRKANLVNGLKSKTEFCQGQIVMLENQNCYYAQVLGSFGEFSSVDFLTSPSSPREQSTSTFSTVIGSKQHSPEPAVFNL